MVEDLSKYKDDFLSEAKTYLEAMNASLLKLEKSPGKIESVNEIFRAAHTLKSMAATMQYAGTAELCHAIEDVLDAIKKKRLKVDQCAQPLFQGFDTLGATLRQLRKGQGEMETTRQVEQLRALATREEPALVSESAGEEEREAPAVEKVQSIDVKVERLDRMMNLAEELLITKMRLDRIKEASNMPELTAAVDALGRLIGELQYNVMQSRLVPIGFIVNRFPRMVRDLARQEKKDVELTIVGGDLELDRALIDEIGESLVHLLRNAVDHGIEASDVRRKAGKPAQAMLRVSASRTKDFAVIEVADDGAGLDLDEIKATAIRRGVLTQGATKEAVLESIFSGVSTTKQVTAVSGRGFGLNIVKQKMATLGGEIKVSSERHQGTTFRIEIPFTLAVIKALFIEVGGTPYAIPVTNIERLVTVPADEIKGMLEYEAIVLNEEDIPITRLTELFGLPRPQLTRFPIVIVRRGEAKLGLVVDALMSTQEIVVKPLSRLVRENRYFAGSTIIGSGGVVLILDVGNLMLSTRRETVAA